MQRQLRIVCAGLVLAASGSAHAFDAPARSRVAVDALRLAPPALRRQLSRHREDLQRGAMDEGLSPSSQEDVSRRLTEQVDAAVSMIDSHQPFRKIAEAFGRIAGTIAILNNPLWGETSRAPAPGSDLTRFSAFIHERMDRFPLVFNGYDDAALESGNVAGFIGSVRARYDSDRRQLRRAYHPADGGPILPSDFDDRSVPFAIASLAYSHAVTDASHLWISIWRRAHGDLSGTPYLAAAAAKRSSR